MAADHHPPATPAAPAMGDGDDAPLHLGYVVAIDNFSGPLDLLLFLVRRTELDIIDIPIVLIVDQFIEAVGRWQDPDLETAGDFILMAATLLEIKARAIAPPVDGDEPVGEDDALFDPRSTLISSLLRYRRFKEAARLLELLGEARAPCLARQLHEIVPDEAPDESDLDLSAVDAHLLLRTCEAIFLRLNGLGPRTVLSDDIPMGVRVERLIDALRECSPASLAALLGQAPSRLTHVAMVLAVLEGTRQGLVAVGQERQYGEISLRLREADEPVAAPPPAGEEEEPRRRRRLPLLTYLAPPTADDGGEPPPEEEAESDEQRFLRELEEASQVDALLAGVSDLDAAFAAYCVRHHPELLVRSQVEAAQAAQAAQAAHAAAAGATGNAPDDAPGPGAPAATSPPTALAAVLAPTPVQVVADTATADGASPSAAGPPPIAEDLNAPPALPGPRPSGDDCAAPERLDPGAAISDLAAMAAVPAPIAGAAMEDEVDQAVVQAVIQANRIVDPVADPNGALACDPAIAEQGAAAQPSSPGAMVDQRVPLPMSSEHEGPPTQGRAGSSDHTALRTQDAGRSDDTQTLPASIAVEPTDATADPAAMPAAIVSDGQVAATAPPGAALLPASDSGQDDVDALQAAAGADPLFAANSRDLPSPTSAFGDPPAIRPEPLADPACHQTSAASAPSGDLPWASHHAPPDLNGTQGGDPSGDTGSSPVSLPAAADGGPPRAAAPAAVPPPNATVIAASPVAHDHPSSRADHPVATDTNHDLPSVEPSAGGSRAAALGPTSAPPLAPAPAPTPAPVMAVIRPATGLDGTSRPPATAAAAAAAVALSAPGQGLAAADALPLIAANADLLPASVTGFPTSSSRPPHGSSQDPAAPPPTGTPDDPAPEDPVPLRRPAAEPEPPGGPPPRRHRLLDHVAAPTASTPPTRSKARSAMTPPPQRRTRIIAALVAINVAWLAYAWLSFVPRDLLEVVAQPPALVEGRAPLRFTFNLDMVGEAALGRPPAAVPEITPAILGSWSWRDARTLEFAPREELPAASAFNILLAADALRAESGLRLGHDVRLAVHTASLSMQGARLESFAPGGRAIVVLDFNQAVDPALIARSLSIADVQDAAGGAAHEPPRVTALDAAPSARVRLEIGSGGRFELAAAELVLPNGTCGIAGPLGLGMPWRARMDLGHVLAVRMVSADAPPRGDITIHLATTAVDVPLGVLTAALSVQPEVAFAVHATAQGLDLVGAFEAGNAYRIAVAERWPEPSPLHPLAAYPAGGSWQLSIPARRPGLWLDAASAADGQLALGAQAVDQAGVELFTPAPDAQQPLLTSAVALQLGDHDSQWQGTLDTDHLLAEVPNGRYRLRVRAGDAPEAAAETEVTIEDIALRPSDLAVAVERWFAQGLAGDSGADVSVRRVRFGR